MLRCETTKWLSWPNWTHLSESPRLDPLSVNREAQLSKNPNSFSTAILYQMLPHCLGRPQRKAVGEQDEPLAGLGIDRADTSEVDNAAIHGAEDSWLQQQRVEDGDIVCGAVGQVNERGNVAAQIEHRWRVTAALRWRKRAHGSSVRHRSIVVESNR